METSYAVPTVPAPVAKATGGGFFKSVTDFIKKNKWVLLVVPLALWFLWKKFGPKKQPGANTQATGATPIVQVPPAPAVDPNFTRLSSA
jgi:hypothetical protein